MGKSTIVFPSILIQGGMHVSTYNNLLNKNQTQSVKTTATQNSFTPNNNYGFGFGTVAENGGKAHQYTDKNAEIQRTIGVIQNRQNAGMDNTHQLNWYKSLTGQDYSPTAQLPSVQSPSIKLNTQNGSGWFIDSKGDGRRIESSDILSNAGNMQLAIQNALNGGYSDLASKYKSEYEKYVEQMTNQGVNFSQYGDDLTRYSRFLDSERGLVGLSGDWNSVYRDGQYGNSADLMRRSMGIGNNVDLTFNNWDNYDDVMSQLNASATAVAKLSRDNSVNRQDIDEIYQHYLKTHARASELGYGGAISPGYVTGFVDENDARYEGFVSPTERGFMPNTSVQEQYERYLGMLGTEEGINNSYSQQALDLLTRLQAVQNTKGTWENGNYDFNDILGDNVANHNLNRYMEYLKNNGIIDSNYNPHSDGAQLAIDSILQANPNVQANSYYQSGWNGDFRYETPNSKRNSNTTKTPKSENPVPMEENKEFQEALARFFTSLESNQNALPSQQQTPVSQPSTPVSNNAYEESMRNALLRQLQGIGG